MKDQLKTIREAMVGEQDPVATHGKVVKIIGVGEKYRPDAHETGVWLDEDGVCLEFGDGYRDCFYLSRISVIPPAQQPQAEAVRCKPVRVCHIKDVACSEAAVKCGECPDAAPQQSEAVPVLTDAEIHAADPIPQNRFDQERVEFARRVEQAVRAKMGVAQWLPSVNLIDPGTVVSFAVDRWITEVANRPLVNKNRRALDDTWRQVIRHFGGDPNALIGPDHDTLIAAAQGEKP